MVFTFQYKLTIINTNITETMIVAMLKHLEHLLLLSPFSFDWLSDEGWGHCIHVAWTSLSGTGILGLFEVNREKQNILGMLRNIFCLIWKCFLSSFPNWLRLMIEHTINPTLYGGRGVGGALSAPPLRFWSLEPSRVIWETPYVGTIHIWKWELIL